MSSCYIPARPGRPDAYMRALCLLGIAACTSIPPSRFAAPVDGVEELAEGLTDLSSQCGASGGIVTLTLEPGDVGWLSLGSGGALEINGIACGGAVVGAITRIDVVEGGVGDQTLILDLRTGTFGAGRSQGPGVAVALGGGSDELKLIGSPVADRITIGTLGLSINADPFVDVTLGGIGSVTINGDDGADVISGAGDAATGAAYPSALLLFGGAGNDTLRGGAGDDTYNGGPGDDTFIAGSAADGGDTMIGGPGRDTADYGARTTSLALSKDATADDGAPNEHDDLGDDVEVIRGGQAADTITGGAGDDTLYGGAGDDTLAGGDGDDALYGEAGDDTFDEGAAPNGADTIDGGAGTDVVSYAARTQAVTIALDGTAASGAPGEHDHLLATVDNAVGGAGDDTLRGGPGANQLDGGDGDDSVYGGGGNDRLLGGTGTNALYGEAGDDVFPQGTGADGDDTISGGPGRDTVDYGARTGDLVVAMDGATPGGEATEHDVIGTDVEDLIGGSGDDSLAGNAGDNQLEGGAGADQLFGLAGDDVLDGNAGNDALDCGDGDADIALDPTTQTKVACEL